MRPYPLNVQARLPRDQMLAGQSRVSGREGYLKYDYQLTISSLKRRTLLIKVGNSISQV